MRVVWGGCKTLEIKPRREAVPSAPHSHAGLPSACPELGGTLQPDRTLDSCHIRSQTMFGKVFHFGADLLLISAFLAGETN